MQLPSFNYNDNSSPSSKKHPFPSDFHNPSSDLFNFPSPFLDEHESPLNQIFFQTLHHNIDHNMTNTTTTTTNDPEIKKDATKRNEKEPLRRRSLGVVPRRRTGKKDRHSKICTAQGVRDRRMRLSLQVARKFFDLQDMLGYDKASKTIEWLFTKSRKAIKDLIKDHNNNNSINSGTDHVKSESFLSEECEVVSESNINKEPLCISPTKVTRGVASTRESREKARARARSRTREKMMEKWLMMNPNNYHEHIQKLGFSNITPFEGVVSPYECAELGDVGTIEKFLGNSSSSASTVSWPTTSGNSSSAPDFMGFFGNWDFALTNQQVSLAGNPNDHDQFP